MAGLILKGNVSGSDSYNRLLKKSEFPIHTSYDPNRTGNFYGNLRIDGVGASCENYYIRNYYTWPGNGFPYYILGDSFGTLRGPQWQVTTGQYSYTCTVNPPAGSLHDILENRLIYDEEVYKENIGENLDCGCGWRMHIGTDYQATPHGWADTSYYNYFGGYPHTIHIFVGYNFTGELEEHGLTDITSDPGYTTNGERYFIKPVDEYYQVTSNNSNDWFDILWTYPFSRATRSYPVTVFIFLEHDLGATFDRALWGDTIFIKKNTGNAQTIGDYTPTSSAGTPEDSRLFWYRRILYDTYMTGHTGVSDNLYGWGLTFTLYRDQTTTNPGYLDITIVKPTY